jgi:hypothetical protein
MSIAASGNIIRDIEASSAGLVHALNAQVLGVTIQYSHRGAATVNLYAIPDKSTADMRKIIGARSRIAERQFEISATQNVNFPPSDGFIVDDTITDELGIVWTIKHEDSDELNAVWKLDCVTQTAKQLAA